MDYDIDLCKKLNLVDMNEIDISTDDKPIIGTYALATCVGVLLYDETQKKAIVCHCSSNYELMIEKLKKFISYYEFNKNNVKYLIVPGYYKSGYLVDEYLEHFCKSYSNFESFEKDLISDFAIESSDEFTSCQFAFDSRNGKFVTNKVLFGIDLINLMNSKCK